MLTATRLYDESGIEAAYEAWLPTLERALYDPLGNLIDIHRKAACEHQNFTTENVFAVISNVPPGPALKQRLSEPNWPKDVVVTWPGGPAPPDPALAPPAPSVQTAFEQCVARAASLPFGKLAPDTLVWKLAGRAAAAAAGQAPHADHTFQAADLTGLFEQIVIQLREFPAPPPIYRAQEGEPDLLADKPVRIVTGFSGTGKTAWVSQAVMHGAGFAIYFDAAETPGGALPMAIARELAGRLFGAAEGKLGELLLPGATGMEILHLIGTRLAASGSRALVVVDNAHRLPPAVNAGEKLHHSAGAKLHHRRQAQVLTRRGPN